MSDSVFTDLPIFCGTGFTPVPVPIQANILRDETGVTIQEGPGWVRYYSIPYHDAEIEWARGSERMKISNHTKKE